MSISEFPTRLGDHWKVDPTVWRMCGPQVCLGSLQLCPGNRCDDFYSPLVRGPCLPSFKWWALQERKLGLLDPSFTQDSVPPQPSTHLPSLIIVPTVTDPFGEPLGKCSGFAVLLNFPCTQPALLVPGIM